MTDSLKRSSEESGAHRRFPRRRWVPWTLGSALVFLAALTVVLAVVARNIEPYLRARIVDGLSQRFQARVELGGFRIAIRHGEQSQWGLWATGNRLRIWRPTYAGEPAPQAPLIQVEEFTFHVPLRYAQTKSLYIREIRLMGIDADIPPHASQEQRSGISSAMATPPVSPPLQSTLANVRIGRVLCQDARLVFESSKPDKPPLTFFIGRLQLTHLMPGEAVHFVADLTNPSPRGAIHASGNFGPWVPSDPAASPMKGTYVFKNADLSTVNSIQGTLNSTGNFSGVLGSLRTNGVANVPDFRLTRYGNALPLATRFQARVDATNGDTWLDSVDATLGGSHFTTSGKVIRVRVPEGKPPAGSTVAAPARSGHIIDLKVDVAPTCTDDFLRLVSHVPAPILTGEVTAKAVLHIPPGPAPVHRRIKIDGTFQLQDVRFSDAKLQEKIEDLSLRGQGKPGDLKTANPANFRSRMQSDFHLDHAIVTLPNLDYMVPGADIRLKGSYNLDGQLLHFDGAARMQATLSQMVGGWKGFLLKPADRLFRKDGAGALVPIRIRGTRQAPDFGIDLGRIEHTSPQRPH